MSKTPQTDRFDRINGGIPQETYYFMCTLELRAEEAEADNAALLKALEISESVPACRRTREEQSAIDAFLSGAAIDAARKTQGGAR